MDDWELKPAKDLNLPPHERHKYILREAGLLEGILRTVWWSVIRMTLRVYHRIEVHGRENLPKTPPYIIVANHSSHLDALSIGSALPLSFGSKTFPLAAGDLFFENPAAAAFSAWALNALPVWRRRAGRQCLADLRQRLLEEQCIYILFPEGTRSRTGQMAAFREGLGMFVAETDVPVVPCLIEGAHAAWPPHARVPRPKKIRLYVDEPCSFQEATNNRAGWKTVAQTVEEAVRRLSVVHGCDILPPKSAKNAES